MILETLHDHIVCMLWSVFGIGFVLYKLLIENESMDIIYLCGRDSCSIYIGRTCGPAWYHLSKYIVMHSLFNHENFWYISKIILSTKSNK